jgi:SAM-dependent methyltransferase
MKNKFELELYHGNGEPKKIKDKKLAEEMAYAEKPFREKIFGVIKPTKLQIAIGEIASKKVGLKYLKKVDAENQSKQINEVKSEKSQFGMDHARMNNGGRDLVEYEKQLMFNRNELKKKSVLDLGSGPEVKLAKELFDAGITTEVVSVSPDFSNEQYYNRAKKAFPEAKIIAAFGENLPFNNNSFDVEFAFHVYEHINIEQFFKIVGEMARTLKPGGKAIFGPMVNEFEWRPYDAILKNNELNNKLLEMNVVAEKEIIPEEILNKYKVKNYQCDTSWEQSFNIVIKKLDQRE